MALNPHTWAKTCVCKHILAYATRVSKVWKRQVFCNNRMNLTSFESSSKPIFFTIKSLTWYIFRHREISQEKPKSHYKVLSSQFYLIGTFSGPNPLSLRLLIMCLLTVIDLTERNGKKQSLRTPFWGIKLQPFLFIFCFSFYVLILFFGLVYVYACLPRLVYSSVYVLSMSGY